MASSWWAVGARPRGRRVALALAGVSLLLLGCDDDGGGAETPVVERYVELLDAGDFIGANALRCSEARVRDAKADQFMNEIDRIRQSTGVPLEVAELVEVVDGTVDLTEDDSDVSREMEFRLRTAAGTSSLVRVALVEEDGQERICDSIPEVSITLSRQLTEAPIVADPTSVGDARDLVERVEEAFTDRATKVDECPSPTSERVLDGWCTSWPTGDFGGVTVTVHRFADSTSAEAAAADLLSNRAGVATATFDIDTLPDAIALRHLASSWTFLQPADIGDHIDIVIAVFDDTVVFIGVSPTAPDDDFAVVTEVAEFVAAIVAAD